MPNDEERLVLLLEARVNEFEKRMLKAERTGTKTYQKLRKDSGSATRQMEADMVRSTGRINQALAGFSTKIGAFGKTMVAGLIAGGVAGVISGYRNIARGIAEIGDQAKIAGVGVEAFQELKYVAEQNRIGVDSLTDGIKELNLRADEFILTGKGSAAEAFQRLGFSAQDLKKKLEDPSALFTEIIGKLSAFDRAAQIRIADEIFGGTGGEKFVQLIDQGADGIRRTIQEARELGIVMDEGMVKKADEVDRKFNALATSVGMTLKSAIVSATDSLAEFIDGFREFQNQQTQTLQNSQSAIMRERLALVQQMNDLTGGGTELSKMDEAVVAGIRQRIDELNAKEQQIIDALSDRSQFNPMNRTADRTWTPPAYTPPASPSSSSRSSAISDAEKEAQAVTDLIAKLEHERSLITLTDVERAKSNALRDAGAAATADQRAEIERIIEATYREQAAHEALKQTIADLKSDTGSFFTTFRQGIQNGESATQSFANAVGRMADSIATRLEQMLADKLITALFGGLLGGVTGGGFFPAAPKVGLFAKGTDFAPGGPAIVGERGPELVNLPRGSQVVPNHRIAQAVGGRQRGVNVTIDMNANGQWRAVVSQEAEGAATRVGRVVEARNDLKMQAYTKGKMKQDVLATVRKPRQR